MLPCPVNFRFRHQLARYSRFPCGGGSLSVSVCSVLFVISVLKSFTTLFLVRFLATNSSLHLRTLEAIERDNIRDANTEPRIILDGPRPQRD